MGMDGEVDGMEAVVLGGAERNAKFSMSPYKNAVSGVSVA
jgi:hypothetical protein